MRKAKKFVEMDATIPFAVNITEEDLKKAKPGDMDHCAVAEAIRRQLGGAEVRVGSKITCVMKSGTIVRFLTPRPIALQLPVFDKTGCWALPFGTYVFKPPTKWFSLKARIAHTKSRKAALASYAKKAALKGGGKSALTTQHRALKSRHSSGFSHLVGKKNKVVFA